MNYYNILLGLLLLASCQTPEAQVNDEESSLVRLKTLPSLTMKKGTKYELPLVFEIKPGFHIMADTGLADNWVYTQVTLQSGKGYLTDAPQFPAPEDLFLQDDTQPLSIFEDELEVKIPILPSPQAEMGTYNLQGQLLYQACTEQKCFFPRALDFEVPIELGDRP